MLSSTIFDVFCNVTFWNAPKVNEVLYSSRNFYTLKNSNWFGINAIRINYHFLYLYNKYIRELRLRILDEVVADMVLGEKACRSVLLDSFTKIV